MCLLKEAKMISPVSSVSFTENQGDVQFLINRDGRYTIKPSQMVAPPVEPKSKNSHKALYSMLGVIALGVATIAGLGYASKEGKLKHIEKPEGFKENVMDKLATAGEKCMDWSDNFISIFKHDKHQPGTHKVA
jgi:hypothetical protein